MGRLDGKVAVVTGASSGIGEATAVRLASEGVKVVLGARRAEKLEKVVQRIKKDGGQATAVPCDITVEKDVENLIKTAVDTYGGLHIAINNAGALGESKRIVEFNLETYDFVYNTNVRATFFLLKHEILAMHATGPGGSIVNVSSVLGNVALTKLPGVAVYSSSKAALEMITKMAAIENPTLRVNAVCPGIVATDMSSEIPAEVAKKMQFIGRQGKVEEISNLMVFLASDEASFITGSIYRVDGGFALTGS